VRVEIEELFWQEPLVDRSFSKTFGKSQSSGPRTVDDMWLSISFKLQGVVLWFSEGGGSHFFQKVTSHLQILGARNVT
jgi:hypothetical protein